MNKDEFKLYFFGIPFIGGVLGLIISYLNEAQLTGVCFIMGVICGYLALITWRLWTKNEKSENVITK